MQKVYGAIMHIDIAEFVISEASSFRRPTNIVVIIAEDRLKQLLYRHVFVP